ncbi:MAG: hypothetical protein WDO13_04510 [Verrucomicrobiota bacterium]
MHAARLRLAAEEHDLVAESQQCLADREREGLDAAHFGRAGEIEGGVGQENPDLHGAAGFCAREVSISSTASASTRLNGIIWIDSPNLSVWSAR